LLKHLTIKCCSQSDCIKSKQSVSSSQRYGYVYDALGRRIEKYQLDNAGNPCNRTRFLWDGLKMIQETSLNQHRSLYIYTDQSSYEPLARIDKRGNDPEKVMYFHTDLNGCPEELTDENGKILWECSFQLWGKRIHEIEHEPIEQNLRYQGQYLDRETGLHYNTFRYYDPDIGRFTQPDPIGLLGGFNLYQYAPNGLTWVDPWGLKTKDGNYHGSKPAYENPGHHDPLSGNFRGGGAKTSILPSNAEELYKHAIPDREGKHWYAMDENGVIHRYGNSNNGKVHWNGSTSQNRGIVLPKEVQSRFNQMKKDGFFKKLYRKGC
jgi:RHS repeat-associated protein